MLAHTYKIRHALPSMLSIAKKAVYNARLRCSPKVQIWKMSFCSFLDQLGVVAVTQIVFHKFTAEKHHGARRHGTSEIFSPQFVLSRKRFLVYRCNASLQFVSYTCWNMVSLKYSEAHNCTLHTKFIIHASETTNSACNVFNPFSAFLHQLCSLCDKYLSWRLNKSGKYQFWVWRSVGWSTGLYFRVSYPHYLVRPPYQVLSFTCFLSLFGIPLQFVIGVLWQDLKPANKNESIYL